METIFLSSVGIVSENLLGNAIKDIYTSFKTISSSSIAASKLLYELDIKSDIEIVEALLIDVEKLDLHSQTIKVCLKQIEDVVKKIKLEIDDMNNKLVVYHYNLKQQLSSKYSLGPCSFLEESVAHLKSFKDILHKRIDSLLKFINVFSYIVPSASCYITKSQSSPLEASTVILK